MTRKCIMCKNKNYKSACSFFSAPKDSETRRLWQEAINIKNYTVSDETYVCSKHFNKDDIITHWVSGVPPQVITIKYKKCRLRRGAVPIPLNETNNSHNNVSDILQNGIILDGKKYFIPPKKKDTDTNKKMEKTEEVLNESLNCNLEDEVYEYIPENSQEPEESENEMILPESKRQKLINNILDKQQVVYTENRNQEILYIDCTGIDNTDLKESRNSMQVHVDNSQDILTNFPKKTYSKINEKEISKTLQTTIENHDDISSPLNWQVDTISKKFEISEMNDVNELNEQFNKNHFNTSDTITQEISECDNSMLFEDFLDIYNEITLPSNWFASMVSKGCDTTIVYSRMNISSVGMPYVEKKVFLNSEMRLRFGIYNKEIDVSNFFKNEKNFNICALSDVEDIIEEFDQIPICSGIINQDCLKEHFSTIVFHGDSWRHCECSMILSKGPSMCLQCTSLMSDINSQG